MVLTNPSEERVPVGRVEESGASGSSALGQEPRFAPPFLQFFDERLATTWHWLEASSALCSDCEEYQGGSRSVLPFSILLSIFL